MKSVLFALPLSAALLLAACRDSGLDPDASRPRPPDVTPARTATAAPDTVAVVRATLTRPGFTARSADFVPGDTSADGTIDGIPAGPWSVLIEARDGAGIVRYAGGAEVTIHPLSTTRITLLLAPALAPGAGARGTAFAGDRNRSAPLHILPSTGGLAVRTVWQRDPAPRAGLMMHYRLNGNAGDASGNGHHGTLAGVLAAPNRHGVPGAACWFSGAGSTITVPSGPGMHPVNQLTVAFWLELDSLVQNYSPILHKGGQTTGSFLNREYAVFVKQTFPGLYQVQFYAAGDGIGQTWILSGNRMVRKWYHVAAVFDRAAHTKRLYVDGVLEAMVGDPYALFMPNEYAMTIGWEEDTTWPDHLPLRGTLDELRLYNRALSAEEIAALYLAP